MRILAVANQKGGCGKTTVAVNLAASLAERGKRVLLIDMDPQAHATTALGIDPAEVKYNLYDVLTSSQADPVSLDRVTQRLGGNLYLVPAALFLSAVEQELVGLPGREERLLGAIKGLNQSFRYILLDCPPSLSLLTFNALRAAREVIVPVEPSSFSLRGLDMLLESVEALESLAGHRLLLYPLANAFNLRTRFGKSVYQRLEERFGSALLETVIAPGTRLKEAAAEGKAICHFDRGCTSSQSFMALAAEICGMEARPEILALEQSFEAGRPTHRLVTGEIQFAFQGREVNTVHVVGDFNNWTPTQEARLEPDEGGTFRTRLHLDPGVYQYRFIVDGRWVEDPFNPCTAPAPFGGVNSILEVQEKELKDFAIA